jgi:Uncharacterised nucleotidyltransferase
MPAGRMPVWRAPDAQEQARTTMDLLLCSARTCIGADTAGRIRALASGTVNWVELIGLARHHGILPLVWASLRRTCPDAVPPAVADQLDRYADMCAAHNRRLATELLSLLALLRGDAIAAVPFKGPVLAAELYKDLSLRECVDVDVFIRREDALRARDLLLAAGYQLQTKLDARGWPCAGSDPEYLFTHPGRRIQAELRWRMAPGNFLRSLELRDLGERRQPVRLLDAPVDHLPPEEHLLVLCIHGSKHQWLFVKWICDVAELVRSHPTLNWGRLRALATPFGCRRAIALGLVLAHGLVDAPLPNAILAEVRRDKGASRLAASIVDGLFGGGWHEDSAETAAPWSPEFVTEWRQRCYMLHLAERAPDKLWNSLLAIRTLVAPTDKDRRVLPLPAPLTFLYYAVRLGRIAVQCGQIGAKRLATAARRMRLAARLGALAAELRSGPR